MSLDAFRGFVITTMVFVNYLAGVDNIPAWAKHMPGTADGFTFVDLVFPGFLFIVGVSLPLALERRRARGESLGRILGHIAVRAGSLLLLGVWLVNTSAFWPEATGLRRCVWYLLTGVAVVVLWSAPPAGGTWFRPRWLLGLRIVAALTLGGLLIVFRGKDHAGEAIWLQHSWWGILGLIGWAYLNSSLIYLVTRGNPTALMGALGFLIALYIGGRHGRLDWVGPLQQVVGIGDVLGSTSANVLAGVLVGTLFVGDGARRGAGNRLRFLAVFGVGLLLTGLLLRPLHGIVKNQATESYTLVAAGICCLLFGVFYGLIDVRGWRSWARWFLPAGQNPLLAYLLPGLVMDAFATVGLSSVLWWSDQGATGALNAAVLTAVVLVINWALTRAGIRLRM